MNQLPFELVYFISDKLNNKGIHNLKQICSYTQSLEPIVSKINIESKSYLIKMSQDGKLIIVLYYFCLESKTTENGMYNNKYSIKVYNHNTLECIYTLQGHTDYISSIALTNDNKWLVSGSSDNTIRVWDMQNGECIFILKDDIWVNTVLISPDSKWIVSENLDDYIKVWDLKTGQCINTFNAGSITSIIISPDSKWIMIGLIDANIKILNLQSGECIKMLQGHTEHILSMIITTDLKLISGSNDNSIRIWDIQSGECIKILRGHTSYIKLITITPNNKYLITSANDDTVRLWSIETGQCIKICKNIDTQVISKDCRLLISRNVDSNDIKIYEWHLRKMLIAF
jgi:WD40 repeat protein